MGPTKTVPPNAPLSAASCRGHGACQLFLLLMIGIGAAGIGRSAMAAETPPAVACDPYAKYECLDDYLGQGLGERLINYYKLEWGQPSAPVDPKAPPSRRDGWPATPMNTPPNPFTEWPYGGTTPLGVTRPGSIDSPFMAAIGATGPGKWLNDNNFQIYGWIDAGANISSSTVKPGGNAPAVYLITPNTAQLDQFVLLLDRFPDTVQKDHVDWGMRLSGMYGQNYRYTTAYGLASYQLLHDNKTNGYDFPMMYGELFLPTVAEGLMLRLGRFLSVPDIESQLAPSNYMYSHSMTYVYDNYTNTGLQSTLAVTPQWFVQLVVTVGTEATIGHLHSTIANPNPNRLYPGTSFKQDPGAMLSYTACVRWSQENGTDGFYACANAINTGQWGYDNLQWFGFTAFHKFDDRWHLSYEAYHMYQRNVPNLNNSYVQHLNKLYGTDGGTPFSAAASGILFNAPDEAQCSSSAVLTCTAGAYGTTAYLNYSPDPQNNFSIRPDFYWDPQGQRTGVATRYGNFAMGWQHWYSPQVEVRPELAFYHSFNAMAFNGNSNASPATAPDKSNEVILSGDIIWHF
ncbi:conserved exported hypothetical protein [Burkholderiales bacterium]|nr:conserved exported hypothetical protein [Burkholderiales bacterium]